MKLIAIFAYLIIYFIIILILINEIILFFTSKIKNKRKSKEINHSLHKFLIAIPAYRENEILLASIDSLKKVNYPENFYSAVLIADNCEESVLENLKQKINIQNVNFTEHSKIESLRTVTSLARDYDFVVILDADNLLHPDFLSKLNENITPDTKVIQGIRIPKKIKTHFEILDSLTDFIYNELDRIIPSRLNITGTLSGSGFAIRADLFEEMINGIRTKGGYDKILQSQLVLKKIPVEIAEEAIIFDEKVARRDLYIKQRRRWFYYHFYNTFKFGFKLILAGIINLNLNQFHLGLITLRPPLSFLYLLIILLYIIGFFIDPIFSHILFFLIFTFTIIIIHILLKNKILTFRLMYLAPALIYNQFLSLMKLKQAKKDSLKTNHYDDSTIDEILSREDKS